MKTIQTLCPAKINLFLQILGKREDGFHELSTLIQAIQLYDEIEIWKKEGGLELSCNDPSVPIGENNIVVQAAQLFFKHSNLQERVGIHLEKKIPMAAGLGGGSSDAAQTLLALNQLFDLPLTKNEIFQLAAQLGSDVPFFLSPGAALCEGRGEQVTPIQQDWEFSLVLINPRVPLSTKEVYQAIEPDLNSSLCLKTEKINMLKDVLGQKDAAGLTENLYNDLEPVAYKKLPILNDVKKSLNQVGIKKVLVSGSGPSIFGIVEGPEQAEETCLRVKKILPENYFCVNTRALTVNVNDLKEGVQYGSN